MFINTDTRYNDNGDITYFMKNGRFRESLTKYKFTHFTPKEKYLQLRNSSRNAGEVRPYQTWNDGPYPQ
jgi:hypothetical protein